MGNQSESVWDFICAAYKTQGFVENRLSEKDYAEFVKSSVSVAQLSSFCCVEKTHCRTVKPPGHGYTSLNALTTISICASKQLSGPAHSPVSHIRLPSHCAQTHNMAVSLHRAKGHLIWIHSAAYGCKTNPAARKLANHSSGNPRAKKKIKNHTTLPDSQTILGGNRQPTQRQNGRRLAATVSFKCQCPKC